MSIRIASGMKERKVVSPTFPLDAEGGLRPEWLELFKAYPDRFLIGSDEIIKASNDHPSAGSIRATAGLLEQLPAELKTKIGHENARRIYRLPQ
jgi:predicted TIM-barrel fold metal-dependent hydrolase